MIQLTRLNKTTFFLNIDLIEAIESTPDTVITLRNGKILIVAESPETIAQLVLDYRRSQYSELLKGVLDCMKNNDTAAQSVEQVREG